MTGVAMMTLRSLTPKCMNAILVFFLCLESASEQPVFALPSSVGTETRDNSPATRSTPMSDREKAGLRGPARTCVEENDLPDGSKYSTAWEYTPDGRLLTNRVSNPDGSEWLTTYTYHADGRLAKVVSGKAGELGSETVYAYDEAQRLLAITKNGGEGGRTEFRYDGEGHKTSIQSFDPKVLERAQNSAFSGSPWDAAIVAGIGVPLGGNVTTIFDENDQPTEAQIRDAAGRLVSRFVRKYDANGQISEEKPLLENPAALFLDRLPAEERAKLNPAEINAFSTLLAGRAPAGNSFSYDAQGRVSRTWERNMMFEKTTTIIYNDQGDKAVEGTTLTDNSVIPVGVPHSINEHGALVPSEPSVEPQPLPLPEQSEVHFAYQYDSHGNWTQQTANYLSSGVASSQVRSRKLTYY
jgi:YD repeat-containing protein